MSKSYHQKVCQNGGTFNQKLFVTEKGNRYCIGYFGKIQLRVTWYGTNCKIYLGTYIFLSFLSLRVDALVSKRPLFILEEPQGPVQSNFFLRNLHRFAHNYKISFLWHKFTVKIRLQITQSTK